MYLVQIDTMVLYNVAYIVEADAVSGVLGGVPGNGNDGILWSGKGLLALRSRTDCFACGGGNVEDR